MIRPDMRRIAQGAIFALADKETARAAWRKRFDNRAPETRAAGKLQVRAAADGVTEILLYDEIGFWGVTAKQFVQQLSAISTPSITVRINSPGGDVFDGLAIYDALEAHAATIETVVEGLAASAASFIALAADKVTMAENALMMIHQAWGFAIGNKADMLDMATTLEKIDGQLAAIYAGQTGKTQAEMLALMAGASDGTWFTADEAKTIGLVDEIVGETPDDQTAENSLTAAERGRIQAMKRRLAIAERDD